MYYIYNTCNILYEVFNVWMCFLLSTFQGYKIQSTKSFNSSKNIFINTSPFRLLCLYFICTSIIYINNIHVRVYFTAYKDTAIQITESK